MVLLKGDEIILCKVSKIEGTTVFLDIEDSEVNGTMVLSEVAAGRIRNLRQYVSPGRLIVCKVLKVSPDHIELSLRRVTSKERDEALERYKLERAFANVLKFVSEDPTKIMSAIKEDYALEDFFAEISVGPKVLEKYLSKEKAQKVFEAFSEKEAREKTIEREIKLRSLASDGVGEVKTILDCEAEVHYLGSSRFSVSTKAGDFKEANLKMEMVLHEIERRAKEKKAEFEMLKIK